jgi:hypothetical protein
MPSYKKGIKDLAEKIGYTPGEFTLRRVAEDVERLERWGADLRRGLIPTDLEHVGGVAEARELYQLEVRALIDREGKILNYFHPTQKAVESDTRLSGEVTLLDMLKAARDETQGTG